MPRYTHTYNKARRASATQPFRFIFLTELMKKHDATISQGKTKNILRRYTAHGRHEQPISRSITSHNAFGATSRIKTKNINAIIIGKKESHKITLGDSLLLAKIVPNASISRRVGGRLHCIVSFISKQAIHQFPSKEHKLSTTARCQKHNTNF